MKILDTQDECVVRCRQLQVCRRRGILSKTVRHRSERGGRAEAETRRDDENKDQKNILTLMLAL